MVGASQAEKSLRGLGPRRGRAWWMLVPAAAVYVCFMIVPFVQTLWLSLHHTSELGLSEEWAGLEHYRRALGDDTYRRALLNNAIYGGMTLVSEVGLGLWLAVLIFRCRRGQTLFRVAVATPLLIALVAAAVLWQNLLGLEGPLNTALRAVGAEALTRDWRASERIVYVMGVMSGWSYCGFYMLLFSAGLRRIGDEIREAARLDGASGWRLFWYIERPLLRPILVVAVLLCLTGAFRAFDLFYVMVGSMPDAQAEVVATWIIKSAFRAKEFGFAAAMAAITTLGLATASAIVYGLTTRARESEL